MKALLAINMFDPNHACSFPGRTLAPSMVHFARQVLSESDTTRQAMEPIKTTCAYRSLSVERERNYGGVKPKLRLDQIKLHRKT